MYTSARNHHGKYIPPQRATCIISQLKKNSWYIKKGNYKSAFESLIRLRHSNIQAARDLIYIHVLLEAEKRISNRRNRIVEVFTLPRNRHALQASLIVMVLQQLCGVNVLAYYSSDVLVPKDKKNDPKGIRTALLGSMGFGIINFVFALPAVRTIDTFGRRNLLLFTFPLMALCMLLTFLLDRIHNSGDSAPLTLIGIVPPLPPPPSPPQSSIIAR